MPRPSLLILAKHQNAEQRRNDDRSWMEAGMTDKASTESGADALIAERRSRRALLAGALGGIAAAIGAAISRPASVLAATDDGKPLYVGSQLADVTLLTALQNKTN